MNDNSFLRAADDPAGDAGYEDHPPRVGFFTDTSVCIGCKACEVACKEWNLVPKTGYHLLGMSFDNTGMLGADSWRHVAFIEQARPLVGRTRAWRGCRRGRRAASTRRTRWRRRSRRPSEGRRAGHDAVDIGIPKFERPGDGTGAETRTDFRWLMAQTCASTAPTRDV